MRRNVRIGVVVFLALAACRAPGGEEVQSRAATDQASRPATDQTSVAPRVLGSRSRITELDKVLAGKVYVAWVTFTTDRDGFKRPLTGQTEPYEEYSLYLVVGRFALEKSLRGQPPRMGKVEWRLEPDRARQFRDLIFYDFAAAATPDAPPRFLAIGKEGDELARGRLFGPIPDHDVKPLAELVSLLAETPLEKWTAPLARKRLEQANPWVLRATLSKLEELGEITIVDAYAALSAARPADAHPFAERIVYFLENNLSCHRKVRDKEFAAAPEETRESLLDSVKRSDQATESNAACLRRLLAQGGAGTQLALLKPLVAWLGKAGAEGVARLGGKETADAIRREIERRRNEPEWNDVVSLYRELLQRLDGSTSKASVLVQ